VLEWLGMRIGLGIGERTSLCRGAGDVNEGLGMETTQKLQPVNSG